MDDSNPFLVVDSADAKKIDEAFKIRNYLSHYSQRAGRSLHVLYKEAYEMTNFLEPGQFLIARGGERLWAYFDAFEAASQKMKTWC